MTRWGPSGGERSVRGGNGVVGSVGADAAAVPTIHVTTSSPREGVPLDGGTQRDSHPRRPLPTVGHVDSAAPRAPPGLDERPTRRRRAGAAPPARRSSPDLEALTEGPS